jgi:hypothetical protein
MEEINTYIFINAWHAPADEKGSDVIRSACAAITTAYLLDKLVKPAFIIGLGPATRGSDPLEHLSPFLLVEDSNGDNYFVKKEEVSSALGN